MEGRHDALVRRRGDDPRGGGALPERMDGNMVATVGEIQNQPNSRNIIPDRVHFTVDIRSWDDELALRAWETAEEGLPGHRRQARARPSASTRPGGWCHTPFDERLVQRVLETARELGLLQPAHGERRRPRRQLREPGLPHGHDLRAQHRRAQPRGGGEHQLGGLRGGGQRAAALHPEDGRTRSSACGARTRKSRSGPGWRRILARARVCRLAMVDEGAGGARPRTWCPCSSPAGTAQLYVHCAREGPQAGHPGPPTRGCAWRWTSCGPSSRRRSPAPSAACSARSSPPAPRRWSQDPAAKREALDSVDGEVRRPAHRIRVSSSPTPTLESTAVLESP